MQWNTITIVIIKNVKNHLFSTNAYQYKLYKSCYSITIMLFFNLFGLIIQSLLNEFNESSYLIGYSINKQYLKTVKNNSLSCSSMMKIFTSNHQTNYFVEVKFVLPTFRISHFISMENNSLPLYELRTNKTRSRINTCVTHLYAS